MKPSLLSIGTGNDCGASGSSRDILKPPGANRSRFPREAEEGFDAVDLLRSSADMRGVRLLEFGCCAREARVTDSRIRITVVVEMILFICTSASVGCEELVGGANQREE